MTHRDLFNVSKSTSGAMTKKASRRVIFVNFHTHTDEEELKIEKKWLLRTKINNEKFFHFYDKYHARIFAFIFHRVGDQDVAADLTGRTFIHAQNKLWQFRFRGLSFGAWLFRIAVDLLKGHFRQKSRALETLEGDFEVLAGPDPDPLKRVVASENHRQLTTCMEHLSTDAQILLALYYREDLQIDEIGAILGRKPSVVKMALHRARNRLARLVEQLPEEETACFPPSLHVIDGTE